jgi:hypothetical protein
MRIRIGFAQSTTIVMLVLGALTLIISVTYTSAIAAFIGLGLIFWGGTFFYAKETDCLPSAILDASVSPSVDTLKQIIQSLNYRGRPVYLPQKYFENPEEMKIFISKQKEHILPTPGEIQNNNYKTLIRHPAGMLLTPPGAELTRLFEKTLGKSFARMDLEYLKQQLPRLLVEDLEIATSLEIQLEPSKTSNRMSDSDAHVEAGEDQIQVQITTTAFRNTFRRSALSTDIDGALGCPLTSAIACAIVKATGKPLVLQSQEINKEGTTIRVVYGLIGQELLGQ